MLPPLNFEGRLTVPSPVGVQDLPVPVGPYVRRGVCGVIGDPRHFLVRGDGEGDPGPIDVVAPEEVIRDNRSRRVNDGYYPLQWEPFVVLNVQYGRQCTRQQGGTIGFGEATGHRNGAWGDVGPRSARGQAQAGGSEPEDRHRFKLIGHLALST